MTNWPFHGSVPISRVVFIMEFRELRNVVCGNIWLISYLPTIFIRWYLSISAVPVRAASTVLKIDNGVRIRPSWDKKMSSSSWDKKMSSPHFLTTSQYYLNWFYCGNVERLEARKQGNVPSKFHGAFCNSDKLPQPPMDMVCTMATWIHEQENNYRCDVKMGVAV